MIVFHCLQQILQDYSSYDLTRPMPGLTNDQHRTVIHEGPLRLLEKQGKVRLLQFHLKPNCVVFLGCQFKRFIHDVILFKSDNDVTFVLLVIITSLRPNCYIDVCTIEYLYGFKKVL